MMITSNSMSRMKSNLRLWDRKGIPKKKRLILGAALLLAVLAGIQYGYWVTVFFAALLTLTLGSMRGIRYALAHVGVRRLEDNCSQYHLPRLIKTLKSREDNGVPFTFVVLGDNRNTRKVPPVIYQKAREEQPAIVFNTGDLARFGTAREYATRYLPLLEIMNPVPVFSVPGNHDRGARNDFAAYRAVHKDDRFSFDYGPCRFIGVNNGKRKRMKGDDLLYLQHELGKSPIRYKFVFVHIPPRYFEEGVVTVEKRRGFKKLEDEFRALMAQEQVTEVFMGHIHGYATKFVDDVRYTLTAGAGAPLSNRLPPEMRVHNYVVVHVDEQKLTREVVRAVNGTWVRGE